MGAVEGQGSKSSKTGERRVSDRKKAKKSEVQGSRRKKRE